MISKEERAELRKLIEQAAVWPLPWEAHGDGYSDNLVFSANEAQEDYLAEFTGRHGCDLAVAAVNALPKALDALDAADERIAGLEAAENERKENPLVVLNVSDGTLAVVQSRWRPIEEAPKDGKDWFIVARAGTPLRGPAYWFHGHWCQGNNAELHFTPTHFCELPDAPALLKGGER